MISNQKHRNPRIKKYTLLRSEKTIRHLRGEKTTRHLRADKATRQLRKQGRRMQSGQILIIVVFAIIGLVGFVGLVVDTGLVFVGNGKLRRATDAAALAAAAAYRQYPDATRLNQVAMEYLTLNQVDNAGATIHLICDPSDPQYDATQCQPAKRRLVKVDTVSVVNLAFMPVLGIRSVTLHATATSEAASLDIVLALDVSESMTFDALNPPNPPPLMADPSECNNSASGLANDYTQCEPFEKIQHAAVQFVDGLITDDNSYDRIAVVPFDRKAHTNKADAYNAPLYLSDNAGLTPAQYRTEIENEIKSLRVYTGSGSASTGGPLADGSCIAPDGADHSANFPQAPCRNYPHNNDGYCFDTVTNAPLHLIPPFAPGDAFSPACWSITPNSGPLQGPYTDGTNWYQRTYQFLSCPSGTWAFCGTTNTGDAFRAAGNEYVRPGAFRQESLWVLIMLSDGNADHATNGVSGGSAYCPQGDGSSCQDSTVATTNNGAIGRHCLSSGDALYTGNAFLYTACTSAPPAGGGGTVNTAAYDVDDYARDMADFVALGQQALIYTIGWGNYLGHVDPISYSKGEQLLNYAADIGDDGKVNTPAGTANPDYFYAPNLTQLNQIFATITQRIATRLTH